MPLNSATRRARSSSAWESSRPGLRITSRLTPMKSDAKIYWVVGSTPEEMVAQGFQPVGKDFPVFLHPMTHEEYALARTERKTARGYQGFAVYAAPRFHHQRDRRGCRRQADRSA